MYQDNPHNLLVTLSPRGQNCEPKVYVHTQHAVEFTSNKKIIFGAIVIWRFAFDLLLDIREETRVIPAKKGQKYFSSRCTYIYSRNACNFYLPLSSSLDRFFF